jgi:S-DNA-T family DNA segregation ATPase FtsK/SpoIIIE
VEAVNELQFLNNNTTENKIINFYSLYKINLEYIKTVESFAVNRIYYKIVNNAKISKINNLINELELYIEAEKIKLDFDKLNGAIVFEISKKERKILYFEELKNDIKDGLTASIGKDINNNEISIDITKTPHLLIAGSTGSGKSCILNNIIVSLLNKYNADKMQMILIDVKQVEFTPYKNKKQLAIPTITTVEKAIDILNKMVVIMTNRYNILSQKNYRNIEEYNEKEAEKMPNYVIVIDELADLFAQSPDIENILCRLLQLGRAAGIHLILATQRPDSETISGKLKINIPTRIALTVTNAHDSRTILNEAGAEKLTGKGDFLLKKPDGETIRGQGAYIKNIMEVLKND